MKKKLLLTISVIIIMSLMLSSVGFAVTTNKKINIWSKYTPNITVSTAYGIMAVDSEMPKDQSFTGNNPYSLGYKKELGINLNVLWTTPDTQYDQKVAIGIASNEIPDILKVNAVQLTKIVNSGMAADITKVYQDYVSPWARKFMESDGGLGLKQATYNGKLMAIPFMNGSYDSAGVLYIRADWLKKLSLNAPKTTTDIMKIAEAFTKQDPDGNGKADTIGLGGGKDIFLGFGGFNGFFQSYGAFLANDKQGANWIKDSKGKLIAAETQLQVKNALADLALLYKNGAIDKEFGVKDGGKLAEGIAKGQIGMFYGEQWNPFWPIPDCIKNDNKADWRVYPIPTIDGKSTKVQVYTGVTSFYVVKKGMKNPEAAIKMLNFQLKYEPFWSPDYDPIYHSGTKDPKNPRLPDLTVKSPGFKFAAVLAYSPTQNYDMYRDSITLYKTGDPSKTKMQKVLSPSEGKLYQKRMQIIYQKNAIPVDDPTIVKTTDIYGKEKDNKLFDINDYAQNLWTYAPFGPWGVISSYVDNKQILYPAFYGAPTPTMTTKIATLDKLRLESFTKIIMGAAPVSDFNKYVSSFKKLGGDAIEKEVNAWASKNK